VASSQFTNELVHTRPESRAAGRALLRSRLANYRFGRSTNGAADELARRSKWRSGSHPEFIARIQLAGERYLQDAPYGDRSNRECRCISWSSRGYWLHQALNPVQK
jgi:hypothetical protein